MAIAAAERSLREAWCISIGRGLTHWYPATFYLLLPLIGRELGLSYSRIGFIMTCQYAASALFNIPGGLIVDLSDRKALLMAVSLFWIGVPYVLLATLTWRTIVFINVVPGVAAAIAILMFSGVMHGQLSPRPPRSISPKRFAFARGD